MKNWTKLFALILVTAFAVALFAGCQPAEQTATQAPAADATQDPNGAGSDPEEKDPASFTGTIMTWTGDDTWHEVAEPAFNAVYPNVTFETTHCGWGDYLQKLITSYSSGLELPDMLNAEVGWRQRMYALDLCENLEAEPYNVDRNDMLQYLIPRCSYNDQIVGLEMQITPGAFSVDRLVAKSIGMEDDETVKEALAGDNYEGFYTVGEQLKAQGKYLFSGFGDVWTVISKQLFHSRITEDGKINFTEGVEPALKHCYDLFQAGYIGPHDQWTPQWEASRQSHEVLLYPFTTWSVDGHKTTYDPDGAGNWGLIIPPQGAYSWGGTTCSVYKDGDNKETTWEFIRWTLWSVDGGIALADSKRAYQASYIPSYEAPEVASSGVDDYFGVDLFAFWASCEDDAIATVPTYYDSYIDDACSVAFTALQADPSMTYDAFIDMIKTEIQNSSGETLQ